MMVPEGTPLPRGTLRAPVTPRANTPKGTALGSLMSGAAEDAHTSTAYLHTSPESAKTSGSCLGQIEKARSWDLLAPLSPWQEAAIDRADRNLLPNNPLT